MHISGRLKVIRFLFVKVMVVMLVLLLMISPVMAYELSGYTWDDVDPLYWLIEQWNSTETKSAFNNSVSDWNGTGTEVNFVGDPGDYVVYAFEWDDDSDPKDGKTVVQFTGNTFDFAIVALNTHHTASYSPNKRRSVSGHELGHAQGLDEETGAVLMQPSTGLRYTTFGVYTPQEDDIDGIDAMY